MAWLASPAHARWLEGETDRLLGFGRAAASEKGGFGWLGADGRLIRARGSELWIAGRMTHVYALGALLGRPGCGSLADRGIAALAEDFHDAEHGGWHAALGPDGSVRDGAKAAYAHAFVILAASSAAAAGRAGASDLLADALRISATRFWDDDAGMVLDSTDAAFAHPDPYRGANANMHTVEAYLAAADVTGDAVWRDRAVRIAERLIDREARANGWRLPEHYDSAWRPVLGYNADAPTDPFRPFGATVGHGLEWSRLLVQARAALDAPPPWMLAAAEALFARAVGDGWEADGAPGFVYTTDWEGVPVVHSRLHWVAAEAVGAAAALHRATGDPRYAQHYEQWWDYIGEFVLDRAAGSWRHELDAANRPDASVWEGKPDLYHAVQATILPRLPLAPALAPALAMGLLDQV
jgi:mannose/cellobiose epimerase-like protein (N-acyl-D-glucosamine 2-epimerase family)